ncbi:Hercynylcysteine sulfoxide lyase [Apiospora arundinis]
MAPSNETTQLSNGAPSAFGHSLYQEFPFDPNYRNFNHGSFGAWPTAIQTQLRKYQDRAASRPDPFLRYEQPKLLDESREAVAKVLRAPAETVVLVPNATAAVNTILRNLAWSPDGRDEILHFSTIYGGCGKTIDYIVDAHQPAGLVSSREIPLKYPFEDADAVAAFEAAVATCRAEGKRPRLCLFDTVSSLPGIRFPFEAVTESCRKHDVLSLVDGAQGVGLIDLDLTKLDPDFFLSNCHKWLFVPRGCAVLYVPVRHQGLIRSSVPTSHGYVTTQPSANGTPRFNPLPKSKNSPFVNQFEFTGTIDCAPYLCVADAVRWRRDVLGGEDKILQYTEALAREGGKRAAAILGTEILENSTGTLGRCGMTNVALPVQIVQGGSSSSTEAGKDGAISVAEVPTVRQWILKTLMEDYNTFIPLFQGDGKIWARMSAQVYLEEEDFDWAGRTLLEISQRIAKGEHRGSN